MSLLPLSKRALNLKPSPTLALAAKAKELAATGSDVISLSVGEPDWATFEAASLAGIEAIRSGKTKYSPANGIPELRSAVAAQTSKDVGLKYAATDVTVTAGAKMSVFAALQVVVDSGDEVLIPAPYWVSYPTMVDLADGVAKVIACPQAQKFKISAPQLESAISDRTKVLILNSPSNPTGEVYTRKELEALAQVLRKSPRVLILSDDIYNRLVFDGELAPHLLHVAPDLRERTILVNGASKSYAMTGWRLGWALGPNAIVEAMTNYQSQTVSQAPTPTQWAGLEALQKCDGDLKRSVEALRKRRDHASSAMRGAGLNLSVPGGAFYLWPNISQFFGKSWKGQSIKGSSEFCSLLLQEEKVAVVPGVEFGLEGYFRLSYVLSQERMTEASQRIARFLSQLD